MGMYLIEYCGLPGSGKSTLCSAIEESLTEKGFGVKNLQLIPLNYQWAERQINKIEMLLDKDCRAINSIYREYKRKTGISGDVYWVLRIRQNILITKKARREGVEVATFDEGCIQFITSLFHGKEMGPLELEFAKKVIDIAYSDYEILLIDGKLDMDENVKRIKERNREGDRFNADKVEEVKRRLLIKRNNLDKCVSLVSKDNVEEVDMYSYELCKENVIEIINKRIFYTKR